MTAPRTLKEGLVHISIAPSVIIEHEGKKLPRARAARQQGQPARSGLLLAPAEAGAGAGSGCVEGEAQAMNIGAGCEIAYRPGAVTGLMCPVAT